MNLLIFGSVLGVSLLSLIGVFTLSLREQVMHRLIFLLVGVSAGALFGDALIHLLPDALSEIPNTTVVMLCVIGGILSFFILEKFLRWKHTHDTEDHEEGAYPEMHEETAPHVHTGRVQPLGYLILASDAVHNGIDGIIIAASYLAGVEVGVATTIAVILHEIPQEISRFGLLLHSGFSRFQALFFNFCSALTALLGAASVVVIGTYIHSVVPFIAAFAAGTFLYIAGSDLVPEIHKTSDPRRSLAQFISILVGVGLMAALLLLE